MAVQRSARGRQCRPAGARLYAKFERSIQLPMTVQADRAKATDRDGVLDVRLPKGAAVKPREIKIDIS